MQFPLATAFTPDLRTSARGIRRLAAAALVILFGGASPALAVSTSDLVQLARAGLSDDVLIALVEADDTAFALDAPRILQLRTDGLSERVIMAMLKSGRHTPPPAPEPAPVAGAEEPPSLVIIGEPPATPPPADAQPIMVVPWIPAFSGRPGHAGRQHQGPPQGYRGFGRFINDGWVDRSTPAGSH